MSEASTVWSVEGAAGEFEDLVAETMRGLFDPVGAEMADESVSEILINGPSEVYFERGGRLFRSDAQFDSAFALEAAARSVAQFAGKRLSSDDLSVEARLPNGSRVHILQSPAARTGMCISIRMFRDNRRSMADLVGAGSLTEDAAAFLRMCVAAHKSVVISGGTGTGKTTMLGALSEFFDDGERAIVIEDVKELSLRKPHVLYFEAQKPDRFGKGGITIRELFRASLRMRPDRIIIGECRGGEALDMIQAMTSGHSGSLSTLHANNPYAALQRLETMALMSDIEIPLAPLRTQIVSAVEVIVQIVRERGRRFVSEIAELERLDSAGHYEMRTLYALDRATGGADKRLASRSAPSFVEDLAEAAQEMGEAARVCSHLDAIRGLPADG